jgi:hypothetical protein
MASGLRPEGPKVNSHARQGVDVIQQKNRAPKVRYSVAPSVLPNYLLIVIHALTGVAINFRPFGP